MSIALWCVLAAAILPVLSLFPAKLSRDFDNDDPRNSDYWKEGFRARARAAHANSFEAFPFFAIAVFVAIGQGGDPYWIDQLAILFILMRLIYVACYWAGRGTPRSISWIVGFGACIALFTSPVWS